MTRDGFYRFQSASSAGVCNRTLAPPKSLTVATSLLFERVLSGFMHVIGMSLSVKNSKNAIARSRARAGIYGKVGSKPAVR